METSDQKVNVWGSEIFFNILPRIQTSSRRGDARARGPAGTPASLHGEGGCSRAPSASGLYLLKGDGSAQGWLRALQALSSAGHSLGGIEGWRGRTRCGSSAQSWAQRGAGRSTWAPCSLKCGGFRWLWVPCFIINNYYCPAVINPEEDTPSCAPIVWFL